MKIKDLIMILFLLTLSIQNVSNVNAKECTEIYAAPYFYEVSPWTPTKTYSLKTAENVCKGVNTEVWFSSLKPFPDNWYDNGMLYVDLWEDDPPAYEPDELVKEYEGLVYNRIITEISLVDIITPGNIDSTGDQTCELYLSLYSSGQPYTHPVNKSVFNYRICMN